MLIYYFLEKSCTFKLMFTLNSEKGIFEFQEKKSILKHNHQLNPKMYIHQTALQFIKEIMLEKNLSIKEVLEKVNLKFDLKVSYSTVKNVYYSVKSKLFGKANEDANNMSFLLHKLQEKDFLKYDCLRSEEKNLRALIFVTKGMVSLYQNYKDMIIIDTTFGLNRFNMPLLTISGVKNDGSNAVLGFAFLENEAYEIKKWVFTSFLKFVGEPPMACITDACPALMKATKETFLGTKFFLCGWHVQLNLKKHLSGFKKQLKKQSKSI